MGRGFLRHAKSAPAGNHVEGVQLKGKGRAAPRYGLAFLALLSFFVSFFGSRVFTTLYPGTVIVTGGIHFHHFWYGILLIAASGGLALAYPNDILHRILAVTYGSGLGLIGDEVGLLLTFGDYHSLLTYEVVLGALVVVMMAILLVRNSHELEEDFLKLAMSERLAQAGVFVAAFSGLFWATGAVLLAIITLVAGLSLAVLGYATRRPRVHEASG